MSIPSYEHFFNDEAVKLIEWMTTEKNRLRRTKIYRVACRMEKFFRNKNYLPDDCYWWGTKRARSMMFLTAPHCPPPPARPEQDACGCGGWWHE